MALPIHQHYELHQQLNPQTNILLRFASNLKPIKHSHLTLMIGFEMIFQGFQPSNQQIEDLEQGNPMNNADVRCRATAAATSTATAKATRCSYKNSTVLHTAWVR
jgi:putative Mn2+ efflux pump MntP